MTRIFMRLMCLVLLAGTLGACTTTQLGGFATVSEKDIAAVNRGEINKTALGQIAIVQNPYINEGRISPKAVMMIQKLAVSCHLQLKGQVAGLGQSLLNGGLPVGVLGGLGTAVGAAWAFSFADPVDYAKYGFPPYALTAAYQAGVAGSYSAAAAKGSCVRDFWDDLVSTDRDFEGTHIEIVYAGKGWGDPTPPGATPAQSTGASAAPPMAVMPAYPSVFAPK